MARQKKTSIDYFPHTTEHGSTMFIIESRWGNDGYATWFKVLERIGSTDGMYLDCRNFAVWQCLVAYTRVSESVLTEILDTVAKIGKIDAELWQQKIIFCQKLVDGVVDAFRRRVESLPTREKVIKAANLDLAGNMTEDCPLNEHNDPNSGQNDAGSTERERERERERESKENLKHLSDYSDDFLKFWELYPSKTGKGAAWKSWKKQKPPIEKVKQALEWQINSQKWQEGFIPNPTTYLNQRRWEDENSPNLAIIRPKTHRDLEDERNMEERRKFLEWGLNGANGL